MFKDFTGADKVYIACGYTDIRKGIDGLATLVQQQFELDPFTNTLFLFVAEERTELKASTGKETVSFFSTKGLKNPDSNGRKHQQKFSGLHHSNTDG